MDTSWGRNTIAALLEGRNGIVCDITRLNTGTEFSSRLSSEQTGGSAGSGIDSPTTQKKQICVCCQRSASRPPALETGPRALYRNICKPDDPPLSVAICPQRECVAFGSSSAVELHWVDDLTDQDLVRRFPLSTTSDFLYFMPPRPSVDSAKKIRIISSASRVETRSNSIRNILEAFAGSFDRSEIPAVISRLETSAASPESDISNVYTITEQQCLASASANPYLTRRFARRGSSKQSKARSATADNYRAVPISDGDHILFTDPRTGYLCLGANTPVGAMNRLQRKVQFWPPSAASSNAPILYAVGAELTHGVRIAAVFPTAEWLESRGYRSERQLLVFYTIPPDMFNDISRLGDLVDMADYPEMEWAWRWQTSAFQDISTTHAGSAALMTQRTPPYSVDIHGQVVAVCSGTVELAVNSGPDMLIWAFNMEGIARCWALNIGMSKSMLLFTVLRDGSVRQVDADGDVLMDDVEQKLPVPGDILGSAKPHNLDGAVLTHEARPSPQRPLLQRYYRLTTGHGQGGSNGTVNIDLIEDVQGVARLDIDLR
ncbi:hypothetical protein CCHL11_07546 [Colletotrichum chlorophyti]|uniref:Uncharacterized protein n=1 Tax=Colletotrichum chlorophyti TaxID=708187 RepID=A0A1Q8RZR5_9PEZI|nr:hypothetical protein CCHL11_07546 [Colletotrichum chlorophyti]